MYLRPAVLTHNSTSALTKPPIQSFPAPLSHWVRFIFNHLLCSQNPILSIGYGSLLLPVPSQHSQQPSGFNSFHTAWCAWIVKKKLCLPDIVDLLLNTLPRSWRDKLHHAVGRLRHSMNPKSSLASDRPCTSHETLLLRESICETVRRCTDQYALS